MAPFDEDEDVMTSSAISHVNSVVVVVAEASPDDSINTLRERPDWSVSASGGMILWLLLAVMGSSTGTAASKSINFQDLSNRSRFCGKRVSVCAIDK